VVEEGLVLSGKTGGKEEEEKKLQNPPKNM